MFNFSYILLGANCYCGGKKSRVTHMKVEEKKKHIRKDTKKLPMIEIT